MSAGWKLVDPADARDGDQWQDERGNWNTWVGENWGHCIASGSLVKRPMTPAEEHAEELHERLVEVYTWLEEASHHFSNGNIEDTLRRASGRRPL